MYSDMSSDSEGEKKPSLKEEELLPPVSSPIAISENKNNKEKEVGSINNDNGFPTDSSTEKIFKSLEEANQAFRSNQDNSSIDNLECEPPSSDSKDPKLRRQKMFPVSKKNNVKKPANVSKDCGEKNNQGNSGAITPPSDGEHKHTASIPPQKKVNPLMLKGIVQFGDTLAFTIMLAEKKKSDKEPAGEKLTTGKKRDPFCRLV